MPSDSRASLAVLPLSLQGPPGEGALFGDALADELIAVSDGSSGGTASCVKSWRYINRLGSNPHHIDPRECPAHPFQVARR